MALSWPLVAGFALQLLALAGLSRARGSAAWRGWVALGLLFFAASLAVFISALGTGLGLSWALTAVSLAAYLRFLRLLLVAPSLGVARGKAPAAATAPAPTRPGALVLRLLAAGPLYLLASLGIGLVLATRLPWAEVNRLMLGGLLVPALWALGALHATADTRLVRIAAAPVLVALLCGAAVFTL